MARTTRPIQVFTGVKSVVEGIKAKQKLKNESEAIAYLYAIYEAHYNKITLPEQEKALERMTEICNQESM